MLKRLTAIAGALLLVVMLQAATISPNIKSKTSFAIIIDKATYTALEDKVAAYRDAIEADGLATWIVAEEFKSPEAVKAEILRLRSDKKMPLEGVVFIGDIPVAMIRDAQHLASAFKMNQENKWTASSIPSDRFYDDFDLKFDFLKQDENIPSYFYYSLAGESTQYVS
ncbi:MAG: HEAT repeat domain-containing protein, partial [Bacteroidales bacterium]|nr:HEAT repeat domain-containing protein [Bacteroidales bacterium]